MKVYESLLRGSLGLVLALCFLSSSAYAADKLGQLKQPVKPTQVAMAIFTDNMVDHCQAVLSRVVRFHKLHAMEKRQEVVKNKVAEDVTRFDECWYECESCGYIYDPADGDDSGGIRRGTPFRLIPNDWVCPVCEVGKSAFKRSEE